MIDFRNTDDTNAQGALALVIAAIEPNKQSAFGNAVIEALFAAMPTMSDLRKVALKMAIKSIVDTTERQANQAERANTILSFPLYGTFEAIGISEAEGEAFSDTEREGAFQVITGVASTMITAKQTALQALLDAAHGVPDNWNA